VKDVIQDGRCTRNIAHRFTPIFEEAMLVIHVDFTSCRRMMISNRYSRDHFRNCFMPMS
jgi:hypothetical protein